LDFILLAWVHGLESHDVTSTDESVLPWAFELSRWRDGRCCMGSPRALLAV
jgi:hypothetical protein